MSYCHKPVNLFSISHISFNFRVHKLTYLNLTSIPAETRTRFFKPSTKPGGDAHTEFHFLGNAISKHGSHKVNCDGQPGQPQCSEASPAQPARPRAFVPPLQDGTPQLRGYTRFPRGTELPSSSALGRRAAHRAPGVPRGLHGPTCTPCPPPPLGAPSSSPLSAAGTRPAGLAAGTREAMEHRR